MSATLDAQYSLAIGALRRGLEPERVLATLQAAWAVDMPLLKADSGSQTPGGPGDHPIPAIGTEERAFYNGLNAEQRRAYLAVRDAVARMSAKEWSAFDPFALDAPLEDWKQSAMMLLAPAAMRAYLVGSLLANQEMGTGRRLPVGEQDKRAIDFLQQYAFNEISSKFEEMKSDLRRHLIQGVHEGRNPNEVAATIRQEMKDYQTDFETIAITETSRAESQGRLQEFLDEGINRVQWSSAHDPRVCPHCAKREGLVLRIKDVIGKSNFGRKLADWIDVIPLHPRCRCLWLPVITKSFAVGSLLKTHDVSGEARDRTGEWSRVADQATEDIKTQGGTSINLAGSRPKSGYMVSLPDSEHIYPTSLDHNTVREEVVQFMTAYGNRLQQPGHYLGGWVDNDHLYLDVSKNIQERADAFAFAHASDQIGLWDVVNGATLHTMSDEQRPSQSKGNLAKTAGPGPNAKRFFFDTSKMNADEIAHEILQLARAHRAQKSLTVNDLFKSDVADEPRNAKGEWAASGGSRKPYKLTFDGRELEVPPMRVGRSGDLTDLPVVPFTGRVYHGTSSVRAEKILQSGFPWAKVPIEGLGTYFALDPDGTTVYRRSTTMNDRKRGLDEAQPVVMHSDLKDFPAIDAASTMDEHIPEAHRENLYARAAKALGTDIAHAPPELDRLAEAIHREDYRRIGAKGLLTRARAGHILTATGEVKPAAQYELERYGKTIPLDDPYDDVAKKSAQVRSLLLLHEHMPKSWKVESAP